MNDYANVNALAKFQLPWNPPGKQKKQMIIQVANNESPCITKSSSDCRGRCSLCEASPIKLPDGVGGPLERKGAGPTPEWPEGVTVGPVGVCM